MLIIFCQILFQILTVNYAQNDVQDECEPLHCPEYCNLTYRFGCPHNCRCSEAPICYDIECPEGPPNCIVITQHNGCQTCACGYELRRIRDDYRRMFIFQRLTSADIEFLERTEVAVERDKANVSGEIGHANGSFTSLRKVTATDVGDFEELHVNSQEETLYFERGAEVFDEDDLNEGDEGAEELLMLMGHGPEQNTVSNETTLTNGTELHGRPLTFIYEETDLLPSLPIILETTTISTTKIPSTTRFESDILPALPTTTETPILTTSRFPDDDDIPPMIVPLGRLGALGGSREFPIPSSENVGNRPPSVRPLILPPTRLPPPADVAIVRFGKLSPGAFTGNSAKPAIQKHLKGSSEVITLGKSSTKNEPNRGKLSVKSSSVIYSHENGVMSTANSHIRESEDQRGGVRINSVLSPPVFLPDPIRPPHHSFADFKPFKPRTDNPRPSFVTVSPRRLFTTTRPPEPVRRPVLGRLGPRICTRTDIEKVENVFFPLFRAVFRYQLNGHMEQPIPYHYGARKFFILCSIFHDGYSRYTQLMKTCLPKDFRIAETVKTFSFLCNSTATPKIFRHLDCLTAVSIRDNCYVHPPPNQQICLTMLQRVQCRERQTRLGCGQEAWFAEANMLKNQLDTTAPDCVIPMLRKV